MNRIILSFIFFLTIITFQSSCVKDKPGKLIENDTTFLSYWYFPKDSYWIYKDSLTNELDTFLVESTDIQEQNDRYSQNKFQFHVFRVLNRGVIKTQVGRPVYYDENSYYYVLDQSWTMGSAIRLFYDKMNRVRNLGNKLFLADKLDSILIGNRIYHNILHIYNLGQSEFDSVSHEYYAKNVGVVKRVYRSKHVWELKEYYLKD